MLMNSFVVFFHLHGPFAKRKRFFTKLLLAGGRQERKERQGLQLDGRQPRPPPVQTGMNSKLLKISPNWRRLLIDKTSE